MTANKNTDLFKGWKFFAITPLTLCLKQRHFLYTVFQQSGQVGFSRLFCASRGQCVVKEATFTHLLLLPLSIYNLDEALFIHRYTKTSAYVHHVHPHAGAADIRSEYAGYI